MAGPNCHQQLYKLSESNIFSYMLETAAHKSLDCKPFGFGKKADSQMVGLLKSRQVMFNFLEVLKKMVKLNLIFNNLFSGIHYLYIKKYFHASTNRKT